MPDVTLTAKQSPRFEGTTLCLYEGDTFKISITISLLLDDTPVDIEPDDVITFVFFSDLCNKEVARKSYTNIEDNTVTLVWDEDLSSAFTRGEYNYGLYHYRILYNGEDIKTIADCKIKIE